MKLQNQKYHVSEESEETDVKNPSGVTKTEIGYFLTNIVTVVTVVNNVNFGNYNRMVTTNIKLDIGAEIYNDRETTTNRCHTNRIEQVNSDSK